MRDQHCLYSRTRAFKASPLAALLKQAGKPSRTAAPEGWGINMKQYEAIDISTYQIPATPALQRPSPDKLQRQQADRQASAAAMLAPVPPPEVMALFAAAEQSPDQRPRPPRLPRRTPISRSPTRRRTAAAAGRGGPLRQQAKNSGSDGGATSAAQPSRARSVSFEHSPKRSSPLRRETTDFEQCTDSEGEAGRPSSGRGRDRAASSAVSVDSHSAHPSPRPARSVSMDRHAERYGSDVDLVAAVLLGQAAPRDAKSAKRLAVLRRLLRSRPWVHQEQELRTISEQLKALQATLVAPPAAASPPTTPEPRKDEAAAPAPADTLPVQPSMRPRDPRCIMQRCIRVEHNDEAIALDVAVLLEPGGDSDNVLLDNAYFSRATLRVAVQASGQSWECSIPAFMVNDAMRSTSDVVQALSSVVETLQCVQHEDSWVPAVLRSNMCAVERDDGSRTMSIDAVSVWHALESTAAATRHQLLGPGATAAPCLEATVTSADGCMSWKLDEVTVRVLSCTTNDASNLSTSSALRNVTRAVAKCCCGPAWVDAPVALPLPTVSMPIAADRGPPWLALYTAACDVCSRTVIIRGTFSRPQQVLDGSDSTTTTPRSPAPPAGRPFLERNASISLPFEEFLVLGSHDGLVWSAASRHPTPCSDRDALAMMSATGLRWPGSCMHRLLRRMSLCSTRHSIELQVDSTVWWCHTYLSGLQCRLEASFGPAGAVILTASAPRRRGATTTEHWQASGCCTTKPLPLTWARCRRVEWRCRSAPYCRA